MTDFPLTKEEFDSIYGRVPRLTVEIILSSDEGIYLTLRDIEPSKGLWHLSGGTVIYGESLFETVKRIAKRELGIEVTATEFIDYIEYPSHYKHGLDHPVGLAFKVISYSGKLQHNNEATDAGWFKDVPEKTHEEQADFIRHHKFAR